MTSPIRFDRFYELCESFVMTQCLLPHNECLQKHFRVESSLRTVIERKHIKEFNVTIEICRKLDLSEFSLSNILFRSLSLSRGRFA